MNATLYIPFLTPYFESFGNATFTESVGRVSNDAYSMVRPIMDFLAYIVESNPQIAVVIIAVSLLGAFFLHKNSVLSGSMSGIIAFMVIALLLFMIIYVMGF